MMERRAEDGPASPPSLLVRPPPQQAQLESTSRALPTVNAQSSQHAPPFIPLVCSRRHRLGTGSQGARRWLLRVGAVGRLMLPRRFPRAEAFSHPFLAHRYAAVHLDVATYSLNSGCTPDAFCNQDNVCQPKGCRRDEVSPSLLSPPRRASRASFVVQRGGEGGRLPQSSVGRRLKQDCSGRPGKSPAEPNRA